VRQRTSLDGSTRPLPRLQDGSNRFGGIEEDRLRGRQGAQETAASATDLGGRESDLYYSGSRCTWSLLGSARGATYGVINSLSTTLQRDDARRSAKGLKTANNPGKVGSERQGQTVPNDAGSSAPAGRPGHRSAARGDRPRRRDPRILRRRSTAEQGDGAVSRAGRAPMIQAERRAGLTLRPEYATVAGLRVSLVCVDTPPTHSGDRRSLRGLDGDRTKRRSWRARRSPWMKLDSARPHGERCAPVRQRGLQKWVVSKPRSSSPRVTPCATS